MIDALLEYDLFDVTVEESAEQRLEKRNKIKVRITKNILREKKMQILIKSLFFDCIKSVYFS